MPVLIFSVLLVATMTAAVPLPTPDPQIEADVRMSYELTKVILFLLSISASRGLTALGTKGR